MGLNFGPHGSGSAGLDSYGNSHGRGTRFWLVTWEMSMSSH
jgi:hypothetical protein